VSFTLNIYSSKSVNIDHGSLQECSVFDPYDLPEEVAGLADVVDMTNAPELLAEVMDKMHFLNTAKIGLQVSRLGPLLFRN
jgi:hypothetical protein